MKVIVERDSVCMGDDCSAPHQITYTVDDNETYIGLFKCLKKDNYFPSVHGNNVVWVMTNEDYFCIFSYFTKTDKFSMGIVEKSLKTICRNSNKLKIKYFSSPQRWRESIYRFYNNNEYTIWRDGWRDEINYCDFLMNP